MPKKKEAKSKTPEQIAKEELYIYYKSLVPTATRVVFNTQYKRLVDDEPTWTAKQIKAALQYAVDNKHMTITSLAIVGYVMEECRQYYQWRSRVKQSIANTKPNQQTVTITRVERSEDIFK